MRFTIDSNTVAFKLPFMDEELAADDNGTFEVDDEETYERIADELAAETTIVNDAT